MGLNPLLVRHFTADRLVRSVEPWLVRQELQYAGLLTWTNVIPTLDKCPFLEVEGIISPQGRVQYLADVHPIDGALKVTDHKFHMHQVYPTAGGRQASIRVPQHGRRLVKNYSIAR